MFHASTKIRTHPEQLPSQIVRIRYTWHLSFPLVAKLQNKEAVVKQRYCDDLCSTKDSAPCGSSSLAICVGSQYAPDVSISNELTVIAVRRKYT